MMHRKYLSPWQAILALLMIAALIAGCAGPAATPTTAEQPTAVVQPPTEVVAPTEAPTQPEAATAAPTEAPTEAPTAAPTEALRDYSPDIPDPTEPVVVTFASWVHSGEPDDAWEVMAQEFHAIHPNITIEFVDVPFEEMHDKLLTQVAANNPPDAAYIDSGTVGEFGQRNALVKLDDYIAKSQVIDLNDYVPAFLTAASVNGSYYGLPIDGETTGLFYRTDRFEAAGLDPTKPPTTWDEFQLEAQLLTDVPNNKYGFIVFATDYESSYNFLPWLWQAGGLTLNPDDPNDVVFDSPEGQRAANFYINLKQYAPADFLNSNAWDGRVAFANGDVAMYMAGSWLAGELMTSFPEINGLWATAPLPQDQRCATTVASDDLVVFNGSKNQDAAFKWIEFVSAPQNMRELNLGTPEAPSTLLPPRTSLLEDPHTFENREVLKGFADNMKCAFVETAIQPNYYLVDEALFGALNKAFYGEYPDGATAVIEAAKEAEAKLKEAQP